MAEDRAPQTGDIDVRLIRIESERSPRSWIYRTLEVAAYIVGAIGAGAGGIVLSLPGEQLWNALTVSGVGFTLIGVGVALSIYRIQADQSTRESKRTKLLLEEVRSHARSAATNSAVTRDIVAELSRSRVVADSQSEPATPGGVISEVVVPEADDSADTSETTEGIVRVEGDGEYRYPEAVPLYVLSDLVQWWPQPRYSYQRWTVSNLVGAYRRFNADGKLTGVPWIVTFRRSNGELAEYRVSYAGKARGASISVFSSERDRWQELTSPSEFSVSSEPVDPA